MKVKISYTVDVTDEYRRAIRHHYGKPGMANREEIQHWFEMYGDSCDDDILYELQQDEAEAARS